MERIAAIVRAAAALSEPVSIAPSEAGTTCHERP